MGTPVGSVNENISFTPPQPQKSSCYEKIQALRPYLIIAGSLCIAASAIVVATTSAPCVYLAIPLFLIGVGLLLTCYLCKPKKASPPPAVIVPPPAPKPPRDFWGEVEGRRAQLDVNEVQYPHRVRALIIEHGSAWIHENTWAEVQRLLDVLEKVPEFNIRPKFVNEACTAIRAAAQEWYLYRLENAESMQPFTKRLRGLEIDDAEIFTRFENWVRPQIANAHYAPLLELRAQTEQAGLMSDNVRLMFATGLFDKLEAMLWRAKNNESGILLSLQLMLNHCPEFVGNEEISRRVDDLSGQLYLNQTIHVIEDQEFAVTYQHNWNAIRTQLGLEPLELNIEMDVDNDVELALQVARELQEAENEERARELQEEMDAEIERLLLE